MIAETERLYILKMDEGDYRFILNLLNSPSWLEHIGNRNIKTKANAKKYVREGPQKSYDEHDFGLYKLCLKESLEPVGMCGIIKREELDLPDLGYALLEDYQGQGFATEACESILIQAQKKFKMEKLLAIVSKRNMKSIQLLEAHGFVYQRNRSYGLDENSQIYMKTFI